MLNYIDLIGGQSKKKRMEKEHNYGLKFLITFLILNILFISYSFFIAIYASREKIDYENYSWTEANQLYNYMDSCQVAIHCQALTNPEIKAEIQKIVKPTFYIEIYTSHSGGRTFSNLRIIEISNKSVGYDYAYTLIHEYIHLAYMLSDESLVDYLSVKLLWESEVPYLQKSACWLVKQKIKYDNGNKYDCTAQLIEYFKDDMN